MVISATEGQDVPTVHSIAYFAMAAFSPADGRTLWIRRYNDLSTDCNYDSDGDAAALSPDSTRMVMSCEFTTRATGASYGVVPGDVPSAAATVGPERANWVFLRTGGRRPQPGRRKHSCE